MPTDENINVTETDETATTETVVDETTTEEVVTDETAVDESTEEFTDETEESTKETPVVEPTKPSDSVPLAKYMQEKKQRQELQKILDQQKAEREKLEVAQSYMDRGYPEMEAVLLAKKDVETKARLEELSAKVFDREVQGDIRDLAKSNDFYSDAEAFADEIKEKMKAMSISAKDAYMLLRGETRTYEMRQKQEQISAVKRKQVITKRPATASPSAPSNPYKLDESDRKALAELKRAQPDAGWNTEKYFKLMKS